MDTKQKKDEVNEMDTKQKKDEVNEENKINIKIKLEIEDSGKVDVDTKGKKIDQFRNYENSERQQKVQQFYLEQHTNQTYDYVLKTRQKYLKLDMAKMSVWECLEYMDGFVDNSDPDTENSQLQHALQTAEAIRAKYPDKEYEWFHLTGLIHDLGKILAFKGGEPQWGVVGDSFPVGCQFSDKCVFYDYFKDNPDYKHPVYSTQLGIYKANCGLSNVIMSWGHDEYLYQVCVRNGSTLPLEALYMIRFHSFYPWHREGAYTYLTDKQDEQMMRWIREFNQFDLYSKAHQKHDVKKLRPYYEGLINKFFPQKVNW